MGSQQKKKKRTEDSRSLTSEIKRTQDLDVNKLALQPSFELGYSPVGVGTVSFVNVSTSIASSQTNAPTPPPQTVGLTVTPQAGSDTQLNLAWTASGASDFNHYNVYKGPAGFPVDISFIIAQPVTNSYNNTGLTTGTTYYYRVSTTNDAELEGIASSQVSGTTTGTPPPINPNFWKGWEGDSDKSGNGSVTYNVSDFAVSATPGLFGTSHYGIYNVTLPADNNLPSYSGIIDNPNIQFDSITGFSVSFWVYPIILGAIDGTNPAVIVGKTDSTVLGSTKHWSFQITPGGVGAFHVFNNSSSLVSFCAGFTTNTWQHVGCVYNAVTDTRTLYRNGSTGTGSGGVFGINSTVRDMIIAKFTQFPSQSYYRGRIEELQYFKGRVLNSTQINNLKNTNAT